MVAYTRSAYQLSLNVLPISNISLQLHATSDNFTCTCILFALLIRYFSLDTGVHLTKTI